MKLTKRAAFAGFELSLAAIAPVGAAPADELETLFEDYWAN